MTIAKFQLIQRVTCCNGAIFQCNFFVDAPRISNWSSRHRKFRPIPPPSPKHFPVLVSSGEFPVEVLVIFSTFFKVLYILRGTARKNGWMNYPKGSKIMNHFCSMMDYVSKIILSLKKLYRCFFRYLCQWADAQNERCEKDIEIFSEKLTKTSGFMRFLIVQSNRGILSYKNLFSLVWS